MLLALPCLLQPLVWNGVFSIPRQHNSFRWVDALFACASFRAAGLITALAEDAFVHHQLSASFDALPSQEKQDLFAKNRKIFEEQLQVALRDQQTLFETMSVGVAQAMSGKIMLANREFDLLRFLMERSGEVKRVPSVYARQICWALTYPVTP